MTWWDTLQKPPATAVSAPAQGSARAAAWPQWVSGAAAGTSVRAHGAAAGLGWWGSGERSFVPNNFHSPHGHIIWIGIVTVGTTTVVLRSFSQQLIILPIQNNALTFNQNMSGFIFHSSKFILLKGITAILSIRCFLLGLPFCNEDASTSLQELMFCSHYRPSIFSSTHTTCLFCPPALQTSLMSFKS